MKFEQKMIKRNFFNSKKGAGDAISAMIMFIAVLGISIAMVIAIQNYAIETKDSMSVQNNAINNQLRTSISISNIYYNSTSQKVYVYVKNIGNTKLVVSQFDLFIDNEYIYNYSIFYANNLSKNMSVMLVQDTGVFVKNKVLGSGSHKVKTVSGFGGNGDVDYFNI